MSGRFLAAPLFCSTAFLSYYLMPLIKSWDLQTALITLFLVLISINPAYSPLLSGVDFGRDKIDDKGIADERSCYYPHSGLLRANRSFKFPDHAWAEAGKRLRIEGKGTQVIYTCGYQGFYAGPRQHLIDAYALADPLLARLPCIKENWRIGHFVRNVPDGYFETVSSKTNQIRNKNVAVYYDKLSFITRGNLFDIKRLIEIWNMNMGKYNYLLNTTSSIHVNLGSITVPKSQGAPWNSPDNIQFHDSGVEVNLENIYHSHSIEISLDHNDTYKIIYLLGNSELDSYVIEGNKVSIQEGLAVYSVKVLPKTRINGFNKIKVIPMRGDGMYSIGHIRLST